MDRSIRAWLDDKAAGTLHLSSVTVAELMFGDGALLKSRKVVTQSGSMNPRRGFRASHA